MSYDCCGGSCYAQSQPVSSSYQASSAEPVRVIGCTCGGVSACRGTCRMPAP